MEVAPTHDEILAAALRVFSRDGFAAFNLGAVARELGAPQDAVVRVAGAEGAILRAIGERGFGAARERARSALEASADGTEALTNITRALVAYYIEHLDEFRLTFLLWQLVPPTRLGQDPLELGQFWSPAVSGIVDTLEAKLLTDRGRAELPGGVHPRRLAFCAWISAMGLVTTWGAAASLGSTPKHSHEVMTAEMVEALVGPLIALRQLAALNEVATAVARLRHEAELRARVPEFLATAFGLEEASFALQENGLLSPEVPAEAARAFLEARTCHAKPPRESFSRASAAIVATVVRYEGRPEGVLWGSVSPSSRTLDERDLARLETFASMIGLALENVRLYENLQMQLEARTKKLTEAHARLAETEKMAALGKMVAGVVHELNTPVASVISAASTVSKAVDKLRSIPPGSDTTRVLPILEQSAGLMGVGAKRVSSVVEQLKRFSRLDAAELERLDVNEAVKDAVALLASEIDPVGVVTLELGELPVVTCYARRFNHVLLNVVRNAAQALRGRGTIRISTSRPRQREIVIVVEDDGVGMTPEELVSVREPGFTAKGGRVRVGLGLPTANQILRDHDGELRIESDQGRGTRVTIVLPVDFIGKG